MQQRLQTPHILFHFSRQMHSELQRYANSHGLVPKKFTSSVKRLLERSTELLRNPVKSANRDHIFTYFSLLSQ